jgi:hypothetical protein
MYRRIRIFFLLLVIFQGLHSVEEYYGRLWEVFPPARFLCSLVSSNLRSGFLVINIGLFIFGLFCWVITTRQRIINFKGLIWFWVAIELINGIGHPVWSIIEKSYEPGLLTAPFLLLISIYISKLLIRLPDT